MTRADAWSHVLRCSLSQAGVKVRTYASLGAPSTSMPRRSSSMPALPDGRVFVGSQNFSAASLLYNRELGLITPESAIVAEVAAVIRRDGAGATLWRP